MSLAFDKKYVSHRKVWVQKVNNYIEQDQINGDSTFTKFVDDELVLFSAYDNVRSIPCICDGLKPSQRKVMFALFKENYTKEIKVAQLGARVSEISGYHHGEESLFLTIINLAQNFIGSNNMNLLVPSGGFGSRRELGHDAASPRYIFTELSTYTKKLFNKDDLDILDYIIDEGKQIEPKFYVPILPIILINGAAGIGTGFSTNIPGFNYLDIIKNIKRHLSGSQMIEMSPYYANFTGKIEKDTDKPGSYTSYGIVKLHPSSNSIKITEIPVGIAIQTYKEYYEELETEEAYGIKKVYYVKDDDKPDFTLTFGSTSLYKEFIDLGKEKIIKILKLSKSISIRNMHLFNASGRIQKYSSAEEILEEFIDVRLEFNKKRKNSLIAQRTEDLIIIKNKVRFLDECLSGSLIFFKVKKDILYRDLEDRNYDKIDGKFIYLTNMNVLSFTYEMITELNDKYKKLKSELDIIKSKNEKEMFLDDLKNFE